MILDSSAVIAIVLREPGCEALLAKLAASRVTGIGAPTLAEIGLVLTAKFGRSARGVLSGFLQEAGVTVIPFGEQHWRASVEAYTRFGKGRHAAGLNFGDCLAYATARMAGQPLLCIGDDFARTDLALA